MTVDRESSCKVNFLLNILGKRPDGFHELETVFHPVQIFDHLEFRRSGTEIQLSCSDPSLPCDKTNLVYRAARLFLERARITEGVTIRLEKKIPMAAGLGGGSGNAAQTLLGLNELFGHPLQIKTITELAASIGSDVPFFLQDGPALGSGRGEMITPLSKFAVLNGLYLVLIHPGFGIATAWAYRQLSLFPAALHGQPGRARRLIDRLQAHDRPGAFGEFYNSLEVPALEKYPILRLYQKFFRDQGALAALMSGSGSTTFAIVESAAVAQRISELFPGEFGDCWLHISPLAN